jgi:methylglutaconyl-CoA hydratase
MITSKMIEYKFIELDVQPGTVTIWLNRPEKRNAFHGQMILELTHAIRQMDEWEEDIVVLLRGRGEVFCAGADLGWMQGATALGPEDNYSECKSLADLLYLIYTCKKVMISVVHGASYGGGIGLAAACDIVLCAEDTRFAFTELKMGLVASCISPYIVKKIGENRTLDLVLTGRLFDGPEAENFGLVNKTVPRTHLEQLVGEYVSFILRGTPKAREMSKKLIHQVAMGKITVVHTRQTAELLAEVRVSDEATARIADFLHHKKV